MKSYEEINNKIARKKAVVLTAEEIIEYAEKNGEDKTCRDVDVVTTATFGPMCSSGCFLNFGHTSPRIRISEAWIDDVSVYCGIAAVDAYLGATQLRHNDPANMYYPGEFRFGGGHVMEKLVRGEKCQLFALSYGTDCYPRHEVRTYFTIKDLNQAIMVNPRNCYQNYNIAINCSDKPVHTYLGHLKPNMQNLTYCSAGQLSPLLNDPFYKTIGIGTSIWLAGARGHIFAQGTQHAPDAERNEKGTPNHGAATLALTGDMKEMIPEFVRGLSLTGYGVSLMVGVGIPIPLLNKEILHYTLIQDKDIIGTVFDYSKEYPQNSGEIVTKLNYAQLKSGEVEIKGKKVKTGSLSSYAKANKIAGILKKEIADGQFLISQPIQTLPPTGKCKPLPIRSNHK